MSEKALRAMGERYFADIVMNKESLSDSTTIYVAHCPTLDVTSQGETPEKARQNVKEAIELFLEEKPERYEDLATEDAPWLSVVEVKKGARPASGLR